LPEEAFEAMADHIATVLDLKRESDLVLDVGCDSALVTRHVAPRCMRLVGVDYIPGLLIDARKDRLQAQALPHGLAFAAADGRTLPFQAGTFAKAYCTGVIHTLPTEEDGVQLLVDLIRVCRPGGRIVIAAVPDRRKRFKARIEAWKSGTARERAHLLAALVVPSGVRRRMRRLRPNTSIEDLRYLEYDLGKLKSTIEQRGARCRIFDYPKDFWSRDFRETRANLLIEIPLRPV
jgi:ubiquinone/menaquinone biosynthesis C-methylase UbiE